MTTLSTILFFGAVFGLLYTTVACIILRASSRKRLTSISPAFLPPVTVFKPLKGLDENLRANLESFFQQDYPQFELLFGVNDLDDSAIAVVQQLQAKYPYISSRLVIDTCRTGYNPKVNNLCNMAPHARHGHWVISDSNVRVDADYLANLVAYMRDPAVGLVTSLIRGVGGKRLGAKLENLHLNSFVAASTIAVNRLSSIPVSIGKSMLLRRETVSDLGGFEAFADYLLEDGLIGRQIKKLGLETETSMHAVENVNDSWSVRDFLSRHYRWGLMRRQLNIIHYAGEILTNPIFLALVATAIAPSVTAVAIAACVTLGKVSLDLLSIRAVGGKVNLTSALLLPLKDLLIAFVWWKPLFTNRVTWRGNHFRIGSMTRITPIHPRSSFRPSRIRSLMGGFAQTYRYTRRRLAARGSEA